VEKDINEKPLVGWRNFEKELEQRIANKWDYSVKYRLFRKEKLASLKKCFWLSASI